MIEVKDISFSYGSRKIFEKISLSVADGEVVALLGSNGAGKSTLIKIMSGMLKSYGGEIIFNSKNISKIGVRNLARCRAVLEQESPLAFDYSVLETVKLGAYAQDDDSNETAISALKTVGLEGFENRIYTRLSGGEKRRVQLARAICQIGDNPKSKALFLDEPSAGLDPAHAHSAMSAARELSKKGCSVVAVLHDANLAFAYADKIALIGDGKMISYGKPREVLTEDNLSKTYSTPCKIINSDGGIFAHFPIPR